MHTDELTSNSSAELYDIGYVHLLQICVALVGKFGTSFCPNFLLKISETTFSNLEYDAMMKNVNTFEWISRSNPNLFGEEMRLICLVIKVPLFFYLFIILFNFIFVNCILFCVGNL